MEARICDAEAAINQQLRCHCTLDNSLNCVADDVRHEYNTWCLTIGFTTNEDASVIPVHIWVNIYGHTCNRTCEVDGTRTILNEIVNHWVDDKACAILQSGKDLCISNNPLATTPTRNISDQVSSCKTTAHDTALVSISILSSGILSGIANSTPVLSSIATINTDEVLSSREVLEVLCCWIRWTCEVEVQVNTLILLLNQCISGTKLEQAIQDAVVDSLRELILHSLEDLTNYINAIQWHILELLTSYCTSYLISTHLNHLSEEASTNSITNTSLVLCASHWLIRTIAMTITEEVRELLNVISISSNEVSVRSRKFHCISSNLTREYLSDRSIFVLIRTEVSTNNLYHDTCVNAALADVNSMELSSVSCIFESQSITCLQISICCIRIESSKVSQRIRNLDVDWLVLIVLALAIQRCFVDATELTTCIREVHILEHSPGACGRNYRNELQSDCLSSYFQRHSQSRHWNITRTIYIVVSMEVSTCVADATTILRIIESCAHWHHRIANTKSVQRCSIDTTTLMTAVNTFFNFLNLSQLGHPGQFLRVLNTKLLSDDLSPLVVILFSNHFHINFRFLIMIL
nr:MAG TPA: hypothetical protein [Caudoviricetes sp.]